MKFKRKVPTPYAKKVLNENLFKIILEFVCKTFDS